MEIQTNLAAEPTAAALIAGARRVVVKVGSSLFLNDSKTAARVDWLASLAADVAALRTDGKQLIIVSSGAVALGRLKLGLRKNARLAHKQAAAAAGQSLLMQSWDRALAPLEIPTAQLLLTFHDTETRRRWLNARATLDVLLTRGALPVINENDSVATDELRYGDNDRLSARVAQMASCDLLILLSDVDGLFTADPASDPSATHVPLVTEVDDQIRSLAGTASASGVGSGGMWAKIEAASIARDAGCATIIACGRTDHPLQRLCDGARATVVTAHGTPARAYKQWIAGSLVPAGTLTVDDGAMAALQRGKSLLPAGVREVGGEFERGACVSIRAGEREVARGICAYNSAETRLIAGKPSSSIEAALGYCGPDELIHRNDLVMVGR